MPKKRSSTVAGNHAPTLEEQQLELEGLPTNAGSIRKLDGLLAAKVAVLRASIRMIGEPSERRFGGDAADDAFETSALDVRCGELDRMTDALARIEGLRRLIADGWRGICTANGCNAKIPMARLINAQGTTTCVDCAGKRRGHR